MTFIRFGLLYFSILGVHLIVPTTFSFQGAWFWVGSFVIGMLLMTYILTSE